MSFRVWAFGVRISKGNAIHLPCSSVDFAPASLTTAVQVLVSTFFPRPSVVGTHQGKCPQQSESPAQEASVPSNPKLP